jgi:hypothetical protein
MAGLLGLDTIAVAPNRTVIWDITRQHAPVDNRRCDNDSLAADFTHGGVC